MLNQQKLRRRDHVPPPACSRGRSHHTHLTEGGGVTTPTSQRGRSHHTHLSQSVDSPNGPASLEEDLLHRDCDIVAALTGIDCPMRCLDQDLGLDLNVIYIIPAHGET